MKSLVLISVLFLVYLSFFSCKKEGNVTNISSHGGTSSHNMGRNCMDCHKSSGEGKGWFKLAGTVYDSLMANGLPNGNIKLYTGPGGTGTLKYSISVDGKGNFYTTDNIDFGSGLYPSAQGSSTTHYMSSTITTGQCNSCHGVSTNKMWTK